jgi:hypothetical protein
MRKSQAKIILSFGGGQVVENELNSSKYASKIMIFRNLPNIEILEVPTYFVLDVERIKNGKHEKSQCSKYVNVDNSNLESNT